MKRITMKFVNLTRYGVVTKRRAISLSVYLAKPVDPFYGPRPKGLAIVLHYFGKDDAGTHEDTCDWNPKGNDAGCKCDSFHEYHARELVEKYGHGTEEMWKELEKIHKLYAPVAAK